MDFACAKLPTGSDAGQVWNVVLILFRTLFQAQFLCTPRQDFRCEYGTVFIDCDRMGVEMPPLIRCRPIERAEDLAVPVDLENSASDCIGHVDEMIRRDK